MADPVGKLVKGFRRFADGAYIDRRACDAAFARMHRRDPLGDRIHLILACLGLAALFGPPTVTEIALAPLAVFYFVRALNTAPAWIHGFGQPSVLAALALFGWFAVTLAWSPDPDQGWAELNRMRWFLVLPLVHPAIERRPVLAAGMAAGLIVASIAQLLSGFGPFQGMFEARHPGRITGWWDPVVCGSIQVGAVGLFLPAALRGVGRTRAVGVMGLTLALLGLLASGTRGAWISGAGLLVVATVLVLRGAPARTKRSAMILAAALLVGAGGAGVIWRDGISVRVSQAVDEIRAAGDGAFDSPTGARIAVMHLGVETGLTPPFVGAGAGSVRTLASDRFGADSTAAYLAHAHSTPAHLLATGGVPALLLGGLLAWVLLRNAFRGTADEHPGSIVRGVPYAILGLVFASVFDVVLINMQVAAFLGALAALVPAYAPPTTAPRAA